MANKQAPGLRLHKRTIPVNTAGAEFSDWLWRFQAVKGLTDIELLQILNDSQQRVLTLALRAERHPGNPDKKADEE